MTTAEDRSLPRILVLSTTGPGSPSATGQLMSKLFSSWDAERLLAVDCTLPSSKRFRSIHIDRYGKRLNLDSLIKACHKFKPEFIYYRPVEDPPFFHDVAQLLIHDMNLPYAVHIMDDWPTRLSETNPELFASFDPQLRSLLRNASICFSICDAMSRAYKQRYGKDFYAIANGVDADQFSEPSQPKRTFQLLYSGALADDINQQSVADVAEAVTRVSINKRIEFTIRTMPWFQNVARKMAQHRSIRAKALTSDAKYQSSLSGADGLLIAYNFDPRSMSYSSLSQANKLPECLASGTPILGYGPSQNATIATLATGGIGLVVNQRSGSMLDAAITTLISDEESRQLLTIKALKAANRQFNMSKIRTQFEKLMKEATMREAGMSPSPTTKIPADSYIVGPYAREDKAHIDETLIIADLTKSAASGLMIDVGAHHGSAFRPFHRAGWTIHAFEPDPKNRKYLEDKFKNLERFNLDSRAVSEVDGETVAFYTSEESTGISGLSAFTDSHNKTTEVDTVTLSAYMHQRDLTEVDFLKVDTEGFDLMVLKGFPWEKCSPSIIECEFEDAKTSALGYAFDDLAKYLQSKGYFVYVSEWHPIVRYGIRHQWRSIYQYPGKLHSKDAWGNLLAFRQEPQIELIRASIVSALSVSEPKEPNSPTQKSEIRVSEPSNVERAPVKPTVMAGVMNYFRIFANFYLSRPGVIVGLCLIASLGLAYGANETNTPINLLLAAGATLLALFVPAYIYSRITFEYKTELAESLAGHSSRLTAFAKGLHEEANAGVTRLKKELSETKHHLTIQDSKTIQSISLRLDEEQEATSLVSQQVATLEDSDNNLRDDLSNLEEEFTSLNQKVLSLRKQLLELRSDRHESSKNSDV